MVEQEITLTDDQRARIKKYLDEWDEMMKDTFKRKNNKRWEKIIDEYIGSKQEKMDNGWY